MMSQGTDALWQNQKIQPFQGDLKIHVGSRIEVILVPKMGDDDMVQHKATYNCAEITDDHDKFPGQTAYKFVTLTNTLGSPPPGHVMWEGESSLRRTKSAGRLRNVPT